MGSVISSKLLRGGLNTFMWVYLVRGALTAVSFRKNSLNVLGKLLVIYHSFKLARKKYFFRAVLFALSLVHFRIRESPEQSIYQHATDFVRFGQIGTRFPPSAYLAFANSRTKYSMWSRHLVERDGHREVGPIFSIKGLNRMFVWVSNPEDVKSVMLDKETYPTRGETGFTALTELGLLGLPTGEMHTKHRRIIGSFMSNKWMKQYAVYIQDETQVLIEKWSKLCKDDDDEDSLEETNITYDLSMLTLEVIMKVCCGNNGEEVNQQLVNQKDNHAAAALDFALKEIMIGTAIPFLKYLPSISRFNYFGPYQELFNRATGRCEEIAKDPDAPLMMYSALTKAKNDDGSSWTEKEIFDEINTVRGAGHETTSNTLSWAMMLLAQNPDCLKKLWEEVDNNVDGETVTYEESLNLRYTHMILWETLRMYPTVPSFPREVAHHTKIAGYDIPKGSMVFISQMPMNYDSRFWNNPHKFCPERFEKLPELKPTKPVGVPGGPDFAFIPFGAGQRTCIGQRLAIQEGVQILAAIAKNFKWKLARPNEEVEEIADITLGPKHGLYMKFQKR